MKRAILKAANALLGPLGARIVSTKPDAFAMSSALRRIPGHGIPVESVIDIGASNGKWSLGAMKVFREASVLAIEPLREQDGALAGLKRSHLRFDYALCAAGEKDGHEVVLNVTEDLDGRTVGSAGGEPRKVPVRTIDAIVAERALRGPFLLKFDTHGYEVPILKGAKATLRETNVLVMEVYNFRISPHSFTFPEMCTYVETLGFRCYDLADPMLRAHDGAFWQMDLLFCRSRSKIFSYPHYR